MKKIIVFTLVLAMAAGSAFAIDLAGQVDAGAILFKTDNEKRIHNGTVLAPKEPWGSVALQTLQLSGAGESDDGTVGGLLRFDVLGNPDWDEGVTVKGRGFAWWQPIEMVRLILGHPAGGDGVWGTEGNAGWNFNGRPGDRGIATNGSVWGGDYNISGKFRDAFYGGFSDTLAVMLEIKPADVFGLNIGLPYNNGRLLDVFSKLHMQANISLEGIADIHLSMVGETPFQGDEFDGTKVFNYHNLEGMAPRFFVSADLNMLPLDLNVGVGFKIPEKAEGSKPINVNDPLAFTDISFTQNHQMSVGVSAKMGVTDTFGFKARLLARFGGSYISTVSSNRYSSEFLQEGYGIDLLKPFTVEQTVKTPEPFVFALDVLPYISITDNLTVLADLGIWIRSSATTKSTYTINGSEPIGFRLPELIGGGGFIEEETTSSQVGWHINPYVRIGAEWGPAFWVGIRLWTDGKKETQPIVWPETVTRAAIKKIYEDNGLEYTAPTFTKINFEIPIAISIGL